MNSTKKYIPTLTRAQSWEYLLNRYQSELEGQFSFYVELVNHILDSEIQNRIYAVSSMNRIILSVYEQIDFHRDALHISLDPTSHKLSFTYFSKPNIDPEFVRSYDEKDGITKFDQFVKMLNW